MRADSIRHIFSIAVAVLFIFAALASAGAWASDDLDTDGDTIPDFADIDIDGNNAPDNGVDSDGDGINDDWDREPNVAAVEIDNSVAYAVVDPAGSSVTAYADMRTWELEGVPNGNWVDPDHITQDFGSALSGRSVLQTYNNTDGTMFLLSNDDNVINRAVWGTLEIKVRHDDKDGQCSPNYEPDNTDCEEDDDDWVGFVMGYRNSDGDEFPEEYVGFTWNRGGNSPYALSAGGSGTGLFLVRADPPDSEGDPVGPGSSIIDYRTGASEGWAYDTEYRFRILYTTDLLRVLHQR